MESQGTRPDSSCGRPSAADHGKCGLDHDEVRDADGLHEGCELLFGDDAQRRFDGYFTEECREQLLAYRQPSESFPEG